MGKESDDYNRGFVDGFNAAKQTSDIWPSPDSGVPYPTKETGSKPECKVCGMTFDGPMLYCCMNDNCPSRPRSALSHSNKEIL